MTIKMISKSIWKLFSKVVSLIFIVVASFIIFLNIRYTTFIGSFPHENPIIYKINIWKPIICLILSLLMLMVFIKIIQRVNPNYVFVVLMCIYIVCGITLALTASQHLRNADAKSCILLANQINQHNFKDFNKYSYIGWYPFQIYWITFLRIFGITKFSVQSLYIFNLIVNAGTLTVIFLITRIFDLDNSTRNITTVLTFAFLPLIFRILFVYNNNFGHFLVLSGILIALLSLKRDRVFLICCSAIILVLALLMKNNYVIALLALLILMWMLPDHFKIKTFFTLTVALLMVVVPFFTNNYYESISNGRFPLKDSGIPKVSYLVMGTDTAYERNGWYDSYTLNTYRMNHYSYKKAKKQSVIDLNKRLDYLSAHPRKTLKLFYSKYITTWTDPTFQSLWDAPIPITDSSKGQLNKCILKIYSVYSNNPKFHNNPSSEYYKTICRISKIVVLLVLIGAVTVAFIIMLGHNVFNKMVVYYSLFAFMFLVGGFIFHTFWETKTQYVLQYVLALFPISFCGLKVVVCHFMKQLQNKVKDIIS